MGRPRTGSLVWRKTLGWCARVSVIEKGATPDLDVAIRKYVPLGTDDKAIARRRLPKLIAKLDREQMTAKQAEQAAKKTEAVSDYAERWLEGREARGVRTVKDNKRWFERYWKPAIGELTLDQVSKSHIREVLKDCAEGRLLTLAGKRLTVQSIKHIRMVAFLLFESAVRDEILQVNPVATIKPSELRDLLPRDAQQKRLPRVRE